MDPTSFLQPNNPNIVHEDFGDEMIVVNLENGRYYTFNPSGGALWAGICRGCTFRALLETAISCHEGDPMAIEQDLAGFVNRLAEEELLQLSPGSPGADDGVASAPPAGGRTPFVTPTFESYTDMQDLLMLDPIHEVDETGWPHPNPGGKPVAEE